MLQFVANIRETQVLNTLADSSSLIVLARPNDLWLLKRYFNLVGLTPSAYDETVVRGKALGYPDAARIEAAVVDGWLRIVSLTADELKLARLLRNNVPALSHTDCETLICARERGWVLIMEERRGHRVAEKQGIHYVTIQALPLHGLIEKQLTFVECGALLTRIGQAMHTDQAIVHVLRAAAQEIEQARTT